MTKSYIARMLVGLRVVTALNDAPRAQTAQSSPAGALIQMTSSSTVGVLLDEIAAGPLREAAAANALAEASDFWIARAKDQVRLMSYRLIFRRGFHKTSSGKTPNSYGPLPLTPRKTWNVPLHGAPRCAAPLN